MFARTIHKLEKIMLPIFLYIILGLIIAYTVLALFLFFSQSKFVYFPSSKIECKPSDSGLAFEQVTLTSTDGILLNAWYVPSAGAQWTVLFCHGNGGNISHRLENIRIFHQLGLSCFIFDYRGYGLSQGRPSEQGTYNDAMAAYSWLVENKKLQPENIIIFGKSLGGSIAAWLASRVKPRALVLEGAFTSYVDMGKKFFPYMPVRLFARFSYETINYVKHLCCPLLIIHSRQDELVPFEFGQKLYEAAGEPKILVEIQGGHNDGFLESELAYKNAWENWLQSLGIVSNIPGGGVTL